MINDYSNIFQTLLMLHFIFLNSDEEAIPFSHMWTYWLSSQLEVVILNAFEKRDQGWVNISLTSTNRGEGEEGGWSEEKRVQHC